MAHAVSTDLHIKLADFGLSRDIYEREFYQIGNIEGYLHWLLNISSVLVTIYFLLMRQGRLYYIMPCSWLILIF